MSRAQVPRGFLARPKLTNKKMTLVDTWDELAKALSSSLGISVTRRSLQRWRKDPRYQDYPRKVTDRHDVQAWRKFMIRNGLNRADEVVPFRETVGADDNEPPRFPPWQTMRRDFLFDVLEFVYDARADGAISLEEYIEIGTLTVESIIQLGKAWDAGIDERGYRKRWRELRSRFS
jgi:hypothetical protein